MNESTLAVSLLDIKKTLDPLDLAERQASYLHEMLLPEKLPGLRENPRFSDHLANMRIQAKNGPEAAFQPLTFAIHDQQHRVGDKDGSFGRVYFGRHYTLTAQVLITLVDETDRYIPAIENLIWLICNEYTWATSNHLRDEYAPDEFVDLFAAETAQMLAETITLLAGRLNPSVSGLVRQRIQERVFAPVFGDARPFWWEHAPNNWAAVCSGSVGMAALLLEEDKMRLCGMLRRVLDTMSCFLQGYANDGGCAEGIAYWNYGFGFYVYFAESLRVFSRGGLDLLTGDSVPTGKLRAIAGFPARIALSNHTFLNYSDALVDMPLAPGLLSRISQRLGIEVPHPRAMPDYPGRTSTPTKWAHASRTLCWTEESLFGERKLPTGTMYFPNMGWVLDRRYSGTALDQMIAFSAKGGHNLEPHNHNDLGHFIIHAGGENILVDLGQGRYGEGYDKSLNKTSDGHSLPKINDLGQAKGREYYAEVLRFREAVLSPNGELPSGAQTRNNTEALQETEGSLCFELDLTRAYPVASLQRFVRQFQWQPPETDADPAILTLIDTFQFVPKTEPASPQKNSIEERFVSFREPTIESGTAVWTGQKGKVTLEFDSNQLSPAVEPFEAGRGNAGEKQTGYLLRLSPGNLQEKNEIKMKFLVSAL